MLFGLAATQPQAMAAGLSTSVYRRHRSSNHGTSNLRMEPIGSSFLTQLVSMFVNSVPSGTALLMMAMLLIMQQLLRMVAAFISQEALTGLLVRYSQIAPKVLSGRIGLPACGQIALAIRSRLPPSVACSCRINPPSSR